MGSKRAKAFEGDELRGGAQIAAIEGLIGKIAEALEYDRRLQVLTAYDSRRLEELSEHLKHRAAALKKRLYG